MHPILSEIKTQGPKVSSKSPLWLFLTKEEPKEEKDKENKKYGADLIKYCATGGVMSKGTNVNNRQYTLDEMKAIVDEAHTLGMKVAAHAHGLEGIRMAIEAGVDSVEHSSLIDQEKIGRAHV